ncbi:hypothetical protein, partial [Yinghuangia seranimata]|uniref:hypothetical protein n=1 Tax=Yinghuangia seranimata TaxID=408067 RepID=UPI00248B8384
TAVNRPMMADPPSERRGCYLALTFGTLLSSQGTDASFETLSPVSPGVSLLLCFVLFLFFLRFQLSTPFRSVSLSAFAF